MSQHRRGGGQSRRREKATCKICNEVESQYTCSGCLIPYCSVACYKKHKDVSPENDQRCQENQKLVSATSSLTLDPAQPEPASKEEPLSKEEPTAGEEASLSDSTPLKPLTSLRWPYISEEEPAYPDPLQRNDPKPLRMRHYEAIASSASVRKALFTPSPVPGQPDEPNQRLRNLLISIDQLSGIERERALQRALGVRDGKIDIGFGQGTQPPQDLSEDVLALRTLAEAIENAVRGNGDGSGTAGLDWD
ncbi:hypothetical protein GYMLUDRAFT_72109 [Collybiopsis luxurians FD-317 M1]|uniref:HIT-type domain-containing protein n=1 Tax=Collybiopsis luxurians FD-317 M1 TaxID=944289 RepID=A0A0D0C5N4_9AGAR|nr:hypothetical protein GYMLUDRAFT_72109 [Collybiopsis luxurians FD-317 M1]